MNKPFFSRFLDPRTLNVFVVTQFAIALLTLTIPGNELVSSSQPFEHASSQTESESHSETTDRPAVKPNARTRKAPSRLNTLFAETFKVARPTVTDVNTTKFPYFSKSVLLPTEPSAFRTLPLII